MLYEDTEVIPTLREWLGGPPAVGVTDDEEDAAFAERPPLDDIRARFRALRELQVRLVRECATLAWDEPRETLWTPAMETPVAARWLRSKSLQHTAEHIHNVLCMALCWDVIRSAPS